MFIGVLQQPRSFYGIIENSHLWVMKASIYFISSSVLPKLATGFSDLLGLNPLFIIALIYKSF
ncbi:hypothetical protein SAMN05421636_1393 [Pricia antarctica]|uniref:Uncharacterized protein n=1 Tax=Pricia antarctica TaxID=641691 RepID=A0A1G7JNR0_9FLAO|nr:hypothetical protein SAMN05421636_1393 [Pricia antarctica]